MSYHQFLTIRTLLNKVCYGFQQILATWCIHWSYPFKQMGHHFSYLIWATIWRMNPIFTSAICDNLFTKYPTHMAYISKPLVRKFRTLDVLIYLNLKSSSQFLEIDQLWHLFLGSSILSFYKNIKWRHWFDIFVLPDDLSTYFECELCVK